MKISFSGIPGSGKTSLLGEVKKILSLKYHVESVDDISTKNPFDDDEKSGFRSQFFYITTQINEENIKTMTTPDILLCDRSVLDQWIYWKKYYDSIEATPSLDEKNSILKNLFHFWIPTYDLIFNIRYDIKEIEKRKKESEFRIITVENIKEIEKQMLDTCVEDNLKVHEIWNNSSLDESAHRIIQIISAELEG